MVLEVYADQAPIDWSPATEADEISQNVRYILCTLAGTVALNRSLGVDGAAVDGPVSRAQALLMQSIVTAIHTNEPRARVVELRVDALDALEGRVRPMVRIEI